MRIARQLSIAVVVATGATACGGTRIAVENQSPTESVIKVKASDGKDEVSFGQIPTDKTSGCRTVSFNAYTAVVVDASANAGGGSVNLVEDADNLITVHADPSRPTTQVIDGLCD